MTDAEIVRIREVLGLGDDMQDSNTVEFEDWAYDTVNDFPDQIAHVHLTITTKGGHKHHYMQGDGGQSAKQKLDNLTDALVDDIMSLTDEEVMAEAKEDGVDLAKFEDDFMCIVDEAVRRAANRRAVKVLGDPRKGVSVPNLGKDFTGQYRDGEPER